MWLCASTICRSVRWYVRHLKERETHFGAILRRSWLVLFASVAAFGAPVDVSWSAQHGDPLTVDVHLNMEEGWHIYANPPGDTGLSTAIQWHLPATVTLLSESWPDPQVEREAGLMTRVYAKQCVVKAKFSAPKPAPDFSATVTWLACKESCVPGSAEIEIRGASNGELLKEEPITQNLPWMTLLMAFLGGLLLNAMPCVFPLIGIKIVSLIDVASKGRQSVRVHAGAFAAGIWLSFIVLAGVLVLLRQWGLQLGWGFQLQSTPFLCVLVVLFFLIGLNFLGFLEVNVAWSGRGSSGILGSFLSGCLATLIATPCTAPFMGVALGAAFFYTGWLPFLIFTCLALGMALPYVLLSLFPSGLRLLPRPGPWMETLKQFLAFPVLATVIWLLWVLSEQGVSVIPVLLGLLVISFAVWAYRRSSHWLKFLAIMAIIVALLLVFTESSSPKLDVWQPFDVEKIEQAQAEGRPVFVDFTASWCLTCQVNKRTTLQDPQVLALFEQKKVLLMRADWTRRDEHITRALNALGRNGVPTYVLYFPHRQRPPLILPELLTASMVSEALRSLHGS